MPFKLHPSGYCIWYEDNSKNLIQGSPCLFCKRTAGHKWDCPQYKEKPTGASSRTSFFNAASVLYASGEAKSFWTFTLPSKPGRKFYQLKSTCPETGDLQVAQAFSKTLHYIQKRAKRGGWKFLYTWVSEAQTERKKKYGGIADIHYHLICNVDVKNEANKFYSDESKKDFEAIQLHWCTGVGVYSNNAVHVDSLPAGVNSVPAYLTKYLGKGACRTIISRRFAASRHLTRFKPITLNSVPEHLTLLHESEVTTGRGYNLPQRFYKTTEILEEYGHLFLEEDKFSGQRMSLTDRQIRERMHSRAMAAYK